LCLFIILVLPYTLGQNSTNTNNTASPHAECENTTQCDKGKDCVDNSCKVTLDAVWRDYSYAIILPAAIVVIGFLMTVIFACCFSSRSKRSKKQPPPNEGQKKKKKKKKKKLTDSVQLSEIKVAQSVSSLLIDASLQNIVVLQRLGGGKFGDVYLGNWNDTTQVALKKVKTGTDDKEFLNEILLMKKLNHPNIVRFFGLFKSDKDESVYLVMEFMDKGSLSDFLKGPEIDGKLENSDLIGMALDVCAGMKYLESQNVLHRDLAVRNLLTVLYEGRYLVKIGDFGLSRETASNEYNATDSAFPVKWSSPEVLERRAFSTKSDVWSFGVVVWEIFEYGKHPYATFSNTETMEQVLSGYRLPKPENCPDAIYSIVIATWSPLPSDRPSFDQHYSSFNSVFRR